MSDNPDNPNAFPLPASASDACHGFECGMTLRDYFAARCPLTLNEFLATQADQCPGSLLGRYASFRYAYADAMLKARQP